VGSIPTWPQLVVFSFFLSSFLPSFVLVDLCVVIYPFERSSFPSFSHSQRTDCPFFSTSTHTIPPLPLFCFEKRERERERERERKRDVSVGNS
jgi:hypothetical protein